MGQQQKSRSWVVIALILMILFVLTWHWLIPFTVATVALSVVSVGLVISIAVALMCVATLLFFIFSGIGALILGAFALVGVIVGVILFPFLLPILIPLAIVMGCIAVFRR